jgi:aminopeptidase N
MDRMSLVKKVLLLFSLVTILWAFEEAVAVPPNFDFDIQSHQLIIQIDPSQHLLKGEDRLEINIKWGRLQTLSFLLNPKLKITRIVDQRTGQPLHWSETPFSAHARRLDISLQKAEEPLLLSISYEGPIYDPVVKERELQFVRGDQTSGLISPEGVYLSSATYWYPGKPNSMARFQVEATIPEPFRIVTQGELIFENLKGGIWSSQWVNGWPAESLTLVAGKYSVKTRKGDGIKISTYFFPEDDRFSEIFLNGAEEYLKIYSDLLGPYPYKKFDIVQNFFSSGYGFPTFTLLAPEAIRRGKEFLRPGALDHEIVHSWWGHYVNYKPGTGNWMEALTTYCANYYYKELKIGKEVAYKHRQDAMQKYAIQVPPPNDYPLRKFEGKDTESDAQIGYGKGSMVFHMLRRIVGKDLFFTTLRQFAIQYGGKQASWEDIKKIFEEASGKRLDWFFSQWLDRPGGPQLKLENVNVQTTSNGYIISGEVVQEGDVYQLLLPIEVDDGLGKRRLLLEVSKRRSSFSMEVPKTPLKLTLDPDHNLFQRLSPDEVIPGLNALLEDREKIFIVSDQGDEQSRKIYFELAKMVKERKGGEILSIKEVTEEKLRNSSVMLLGENWKAPVISKLLPNLPKPIDHKESSFFIKGERVEERDESFLLTFSNPLHPGRWMTIYFGRSASALSRAKYLFFYGWDSYILFKNGRPKERGNFSPRSSSVSYDFLSKDYFAKIETQRLKEHISTLASPELAGRFPGTPGYQKAQTYLIKQLEGMGMTPILQPFSITLKDIKESTLVLKGSNREGKLKAIPFRFSKKGKWEGPFIFIDQSKTEEMDKLSGKGGMVFLDLTKDFRYEQLLKKIKELQSKQAKAILFFIKEEDLDHLAPYITYPSYFPPKLDEKLMKREKEGNPVQRLIEASKVAARAMEPDFSINIPIFFVPYTQAEEGWTKNLFDQKDASIEINLRFKVMRFQDANIGGIMEGHDPEKKKEFLVLGAHYDHLGKDEKSGFYYSGADDNASGVSALLEIGRSLMKRKTDLKRSVLLVFFGGEEWGLWGSRYFVNQPLVPLTQIKAMFSLDTIGGVTDEKEVFLVGGSTYSSLVQRSKRFLEPLGIKEGKNIDQYSFEFGSDHYPFHQKGIPALDFFASDYKKMHTSRDRLESIDFEKLAEVAKLIYLTAYEFLTEP